MVFRQKKILIVSLLDRENTIKFHSLLAVRVRGDTGLNLAFVECVDIAVV
jgi:hypothetical protein